MATKPHRQTVFEELHRLVTEYDGLDHADDRWNLDDTLSELIVRLNGETRRARKQRQAAEVSSPCNSAVPTSQALTITA